jgi:hypothetical protein
MPGCLHGPDTTTCPKYNLTDTGCTNHAPGTGMLVGGVFALGLPNGFRRFGPSKPRNIEVFVSYDAMVDVYPNLKTIYSRPVWKHLDKQGNTIVRWFSPRTHSGWSAVTAGDCRAELPTAVEITQENVDWMD